MMPTRQWVGMQFIYIGESSDYADSSKMIGARVWTPTSNFVAQTDGLGLLILNHFRH